MTDRSKNDLEAGAALERAIRRSPGRPRRDAVPPIADVEGERLRMTVDFPPATTLRLKTLKEKLEAPSYIDVLRTALKVLEAAVEAKKRGAELVIIEKDGTERTYEGLLAA